MQPNALLSEGLAVLDVISPVSQAAGTVTTGWINAGKALSFLALLQTGVLGAAATVDAKLQQASDSGGTGAKDVANKAITQLVKATDDNHQVEINLKPEELDVSGGFGFFRLSVTVGTAASLISAVVLGAFPRQGDGASLNKASVVQTVS